MKKKVQLSSFDIMVLTQELRKALIGGFIDKVYQPEKDIILIKITVPTGANSNGQVKKDSSLLNNDSLIGDELSGKYDQLILSIKVGKYLFFEFKEKGFDVVPSILDQKSDFGQSSTKSTPSSFAMLLRKHLKNGKVLRNKNESSSLVLITT